MTKRFSTEVKDYLDKIQDNSNTILLGKIAQNNQNNTIFSQKKSKA